MLDFKKNEDTDLNLGDFMGDVMEGKTSDDFYYYEPWDPSDDAIALERLSSPTEGFEIGYHNSTKPMRLCVAGNRNGKSLMMAMDSVIMMTGEIPFSLRYPKGVKTNIVRLWEDDGAVDSLGGLNRIRFGFCDPITGLWTPPEKFPDMPSPNYPKDAPCGFIEGAGIFPSEKISKRKNDSVWICTYKVTKDERWIKLISSLLPMQYKDTRFAMNGYNQRHEKFRLTNGNEITFITYEQGPERAQGANVFGLFLDEEPKNRKFWTECDQRLIAAGFDGYQSMSFTPLFGLSWAYYDLYKPAKDGLIDHIALFHASQYDNPYISEATIERRKAKYKAWEIQARCYGRFSEMKGRPYYDYHKLIGTVEERGWLDLFVPNSTYCSLLPLTGSEGQHLEELLFNPISLTATTKQDETFSWEFFEEGVKPETAYYITADTAQGAEKEEDAQDRNSAYIFRCPNERENPVYPVVVAAMRTSIPTLSFARLVWYAGMYFNYATLVPESTGETGAVFASEIREWPFMYYSTLINDKTRKPKQKWGFDMNANTRTPVWDYVGDFINDHESPQCLKHLWLLTECSQAIYNKNGRPDHPDRGTSDCITAFGIGLYVFRHFRNQFHCNSSFKAEQYKEKKTIFNSYPGMETSKKSGFIGSTCNRRKNHKNQTKMLIG